MGSLKKLYGWYSTGKIWKPILVSVSGKVVISGIPGHHLSHEIDGSDEIEGLSDITPDRIKIETKARAYLNTNQLDLVHNTPTKVLLDTENYDIGSDFDLTNSKFIAPIAGTYLIIGSIFYYSVVADKEYYAMIFKNGAYVATGKTTSPTTHTFNTRVSDIVQLAIDDDITLYANHKAGVNTIDILKGSDLTYMAICLLSV